MKIMTCYIDASAWQAILNKNDVHHEAAAEYFRELLENNSKLVTNNRAVDEALVAIKQEVGADFAQKFLNIIDESVLTVNLRTDWISRRLRRNALHQFVKNTDPAVTLEHLYIFETVKRKKVDILFSFDKNLQFLGLPLMPKESDS